MLLDRLVVRKLLSAPVLEKLEHFFIRRLLLLLVPLLHVLKLLDARYEALVRNLVN